MNNIRKRSLDESLGMLYRQFFKEYGGIAIYGDRSEDSNLSKAFYDGLAELPKAVSDLAGCSDAAFYSSSRKLLCLIMYAEVSGPITEKEKIKIEELLHPSGLASVLISVFSTRFEFSQVADQIAWGTKVWIANEPNHMIHYDDKPVMQAR
ncbi:BsuBI/PstI family type II restriction endonuclease [Halomonas piscis]|uniref:BsuBI/PstI family type II restriction endonuclease n=1 Tax=Halomonas piscis TaxID=3031727 RepID=UPI00289834AD|nr:BsuBI/PstI family type II restriction endonuclease [Halomonas piscis]